MAGTTGYPLYGTGLYFHIFHPLPRATGCMDVMDLHHPLTAVAVVSAILLARQWRSLVSRS